MKLVQINWELELRTGNLNVDLIAVEWSKDSYYLKLYSKEQILFNVYIKINL